MVLVAFFSLKRSSGLVFLATDGRRSRGFSRLNNINLLPDEKSLFRRPSWSYGVAHPQGHFRVWFSMNARAMTPQHAPHTPPLLCRMGLLPPEFEIECKPDQYKEVTVGSGTRMIPLETWWTTVGEVTTSEWSFQVVNAASSFLYYFDYGGWGTYGATLQGGAGAAVIATITAADAAGNQDSCSFLMMLWPRGSELKERSVISFSLAVRPTL